MRTLKFKIWDCALKKFLFKGEGCLIQHCSYSDQVEYLQFTGYLDKNKKEIYEGDILKCGNHCGEVIFKNGSYCIINDMFDWLLDKESDNGVDCIYEEVIGNIYENEGLRINK